MQRFLLIICLSFVVHSLNAQDSCITKTKVRDYAVSYVRDFKRVIVSPIQFSKKEWLISAGVVAVGTGLYFSDKNINNWINGNRSLKTQKILHYGFEGWGSGVYTGVLVGGVFLTGVFIKNCRHINASSNAAKAFLISALFVRVPKLLLNRARPYENKGFDFWSGPFGDSDYSFPSGHTISAFAAASAFSNYYKSTTVSIVAYSLASGVAISRVYEGAHWASDVFIGAALGWGIGKLVNKGYNDNFEFSSTGTHFRMAYNF